MLIPGTYHWTEEISVYSVVDGTGPDTGTIVRKLELNNVQCTVQPASDAELIRHGLDTSLPTFWVRMRASTYTPELHDEVHWRGDLHEIVSRSEGLDIDVQFFMRLRGAVHANEP